MTPIAVKTLVLEAMRYSVSASGRLAASRSAKPAAGPREAVAADHAHGGARQAFLAHERAGAAEQLLGDGRDALSISAPVAGVRPGRIVRPGPPSGKAGRHDRAVEIGLLPAGEPPR